MLGVFIAARLFLRLVLTSQQAATVMKKRFLLLALFICWCKLECLSMRNIFSLVGLSEQLATVAIIKCWSIHRWQAVLKTSTYISTACHCCNRTFLLLALFICWYKLECLSMTSIFSLVGLSEQTATVAIKCWSVHHCQAVLKTCTGCHCCDKTFYH